ncbi:MAG: hypothetical protein IT381_17070 [Deltaproteobacteria bacterium]|nr:hypothetical protein [Deltaproteobacteria bacterium]
MAKGTFFAARCARCVIALGALCLIAREARATSGVVYDADTFAPVSGAALTLVDDATGQPVPRAQLGPGQQGQRTGATGAYQFDPPAGTFRIVVAPPIGLYEFPAALPIGGTAAAPNGALAAAGPGNLVSPFQRPQAGAVNPYYLRFTSAGARGEFLNNHIPIQAVTGLVRVTIETKTPRITTGERAVISARIMNGSKTALPQPLLAPMDFALAFAPGFQLVAGSVTVTDLGASAPAAVAISTGPNMVALNNLSVPAGTTYEIRYMVNAGPQTRPQRYDFTARLDGALGALHPQVQTSVYVEADPIFDRSEVIGRVYCDKNENGFFDPGEHPVARARVYLDNGSYSVADGAGKYHFSNVQPGYHLAKVDEDTVPPGSQATRSNRRDFHLTWGTPAKIDFGFRCVFDRVKAFESQPASVPTIDISGSEEPLAINVGDEQYLAHVVDVDLRVKGEAPAFDGSPRTLRPTSPGALPEIVFHTRHAGMTPAQAHALIIRNEKLDVLYRVDGIGPPPKEIVTDLKDKTRLAVEPNAAYFYDLTVWSNDEITRSPRRAFVVEALPAPSGKPEPIATLRGELFTPTNKATPELLAKIGEIKDKLQGGGPIAVEVHVANDGPAAERQPTTDKRAQAVKKVIASYGVDEARITATGKADKEPLVPNLGQKGRELNRRVTITMVPMLAASQPASLPSSLPNSADQRASVHGVDVAFDGGEWKTNVFPTERTTVFMQAKDGRAFGVRKGYAPAEAKAKARAEVQGGVASDAIFIDGVPTPLPLATFGCTLAGGTGFVKDGRLVSPLVFTFTGDIDKLQDLRLGLYDRTDTLQQLVKVPAGEKILKYDGGGLALVPGSYAYRCAAKDSEGGNVMTAPELFTLTQPTLQETLVRGALFTEKTIGLDLKRALDQILATAGKDVALTISVHSGAGPTADPKREELQTLAEAGFIKSYLEQKGAKNVVVRGLGKSEPLIPPLGKRALDVNRRVAISYSGPASDVAELPPLKPPEPRRVTINGTETKLDEKGQFAHNVRLDRGEITILMQNGQGRETTLVMKPGSSSGPSRTGRMPFAGEPTPELAFTAVEEKDEPASMATIAPVSKKNRVTIDLPAENAVVKQDRLIAFAHGPPGTSITVVDADLLPPEASSQASSQPASQPLAKDKKKRALAAMAELDAMASSQPASQPASQLASVPASAPASEPASKPMQPLVAAAASQPASLPASALTFVLDAEGQVEINVPLKDGKNKIAFMVTTPHGEKSTLVRQVMMSPNRWFLLALAEGSIGQSGALGMLPEANEESTIKVANGDYFLHGRAVLYFKGRLKGDWFFKDNRFTAYVDTAQPQTSTFWRNVVEPDKFYPIYGDASEEVQDAQSGKKLYVLVEADASKLEAGNIVTQVKGVELFRYDRAIFGARVAWDRGFSKYDHTKLDAFVGQPLQSSRRVHVALRGTGGALYFLRDRDVLEGSEQVRIVVRDGVSGTVVQDVVKKRNVDYTISYDTGRLVFLEPVASLTSGSFGGMLMPISVAQGNPVYIEVDYEARDFGLGNQLAGGGYVKETLFDRVTVGGGFVTERRGDGSRPEYRLYGASVEAKPWDGIVVSGELNHSEGRDTDLSVTADGGQSFADVQKPETVMNADGSQKPVSGYAMKATFALDFQKIFKFPKELVTVSGYAARIDPNFYASGATFEQGQVKFGVAAKGTITKKDFVLARHDGIYSDLPAFLASDLRRCEAQLGAAADQGCATRRMNRQLTLIGYEHVDDKWSAGLSYYHGFADDSATVPFVNTDTLTLRGAYKVTPKLTLFATQEFILRGDPSFITKVADQFATEIGLRYQLHKYLEAQISETVRYGGSNATTVGLRTPFGEDGRIYVSERFSRDLGGWTTTTIVGGENTIARGSKAYGEYQVDATAFGPHARAVYGLNNRWELAEGLYFNLLYERSQNVGNAPGVGTGRASELGGFPATSGTFVGQGSGMLARDRAFYNPSAILGLQFPVGIASRDAGSVGFELVRWKAMKLTGRFEARFDNQDSALGGNDRLTLYLTLGLMLQLHRDLSFMGKVEWADAHEWQQGRPIAGLTQMTFGFAYRPVKHDWVNALVKYTRRGFMRPIDLGNGYENEVVDVVSLVPMIELPVIRTQLVEKLAVKLQQLELDDLAAQRTTSMLWINRLNVHILKWLDVSAEYRMKLVGNALQNGFLAEISVSPWDYVRVGVGYNFTHFSDDELADDRIDNKGFFIRAVGKY